MNLFYRDDETAKDVVLVYVRFGAVLAIVCVLVWALFL